MGKDSVPIQEYRSRIRPLQFPYELAGIDVVDIEHVVAVPIEVARAGIHVVSGQLRLRGQCFLQGACGCAVEHQLGAPPQDVPGLGRVKDQGGYFLYRHRLLLPAAVVLLQVELCVYFQGLAIRADGRLAGSGGACFCQHFFLRHVYDEHGVFVAPETLRSNHQPVVIADPFQGHLGIRPPPLEAHQQTRSAPESGVWRG